MSAAPKFTPGPWDLGWVSDGSGNEVVDRAYVSSGPDIEQACDVRIDGPNAKENARLIAAAPKLYAACENLLRQFDALQVPVKHPNQAAERADARAVLKMARGES